MTKDKKIKEITDELRKSDLPQILIDSFENDFTRKPLNLEEINILKEHSIQCFNKHSELINKLPDEVATCFIYDYCTNYDKKDVVVNNYSYYKGYKNIFYLIIILFFVRNIFKVIQSKIISYLPIFDRRLFFRKYASILLC